MLSTASQLGSFTTLNLPIAPTAYFQAGVSSTGTSVTALATQTNLTPVSIQSITQTTATVGQSLGVTFTVKNEGTQKTPVSSWVDSVYLSPSSTIGATAVLLGQVTSPGAVAAGASYQETVTASVPALLPGQYFVIVQADSGDVVPDTNRGESTLASSAAISVTVPSLSIGTPLSGTISGGQDLCFEVSPSAGEDVTVVASSSVAGFAAVFESSSGIPSTTTFDQSASNAGQATQAVEFFDPQAGPYFVLLEGQTAAGSGISFTLTAAPAALSLTGLGATSGSNAGQVTVPLFGTFFQTGLQASLVGTNNASQAAVSVFIASRTQAYATFNLSTLALGTYEVQVTAAGQTASLPAAFSVVSGTVGQFQVQLSFSNATATSAGPSEGLITYSNTGDTDLVAPLLHLDSDGQAAMRLDSSDPYSDNPLLLIAASSSGPAGVLRPGEQSEITFEALPTTGSGGALDIGLAQETSSSTTAINYTALEQQIQPAGTTDASFAPILEQIENEAGPTCGGLVTLIAQTATAVGLQGSGQGNGSFYSAPDVFAKIVSNATGQANGEITGQLFLNDNSNPLAGATVSIATADQSQGDTAVTFNDGSFVFPEMPEGTYDLTVSGYLLAAPVQVVVPSSGFVSGLDVTVTPGASISGTLVNEANNEPISGEMVVAQGTGTTNYAAMTNSNGNYTISGLPPDTYTVSAGGDTFAPGSSSAIQLAAQQATTGVDLTLEPAATLQGQLLSDGVAVSQAEVTLVDSSGVSHSTETDSNGQYSITGLVAGTAELSVQAPGFAPASAQVMLTVGDTTTAPNIPLTPGAAISVTVMDSSGNPLANAAVTLSSNGAQVAELSTDASGQVSFPDLAAGTFSLDVLDLNYVTTDDTVSVQTGQTLTQTYALGAAGSIQGEVTNGSGNPLANVPVTLTYSDGTIDTETTGTDGSYSITNLVLGTYAVTVGINPGIDRQDVVLSASALEATENFTLAGASLTGQVDESDGATSVPGATVALVQGGNVLVGVTADDNGDYQFEGVPAGSYSIVATDTSAITAAVSVTVGSGNVQVPALSLGALTLSGVVQDGSANPISGATIVVEPTAVDGASFDQFATSAANGSFSVTGLVPGQYTVLIGQDGFADASQSVNLTASTTLPAVTLVVGHSISGQVTSTDSQPVDGATVSIFNQTTAQFVSAATTDASGNFTVSNLAAGTYDLVAGAANFGSTEVDGLVLGSNPLSQNVQIGSSTIQVSGEVTDPNGQPVFNALVTFVNGKSEDILSTSTLLNGTFSVNQLPAGTFTIQYSVNGHFPAQQTNIVVQNGQATSVPAVVLKVAGADNAIGDINKQVEGALGALAQQTFSNGLITDPRPLASPLQDTTLTYSSNSCDAVIIAAHNFNVAAGDALQLYIHTVSQFQEIYTEAGSVILGAIKTLISTGLKAAAIAAASAEMEAYNATKIAIQAVDTGSGAAGNAADVAALLAAAQTFGPALAELGSVVVELGVAADESHATPLQVYSAVVTGASTIVGLFSVGTKAAAAVELLEHSPFLAALGPFADIVGIGLDLLSFVLNAAIAVNNINTLIPEYQNTLNEYQEQSNELPALLAEYNKAVTDCQNGHQHQPATTPVPPDVQTVSCSQVTLPFVFQVTTNLDALSGPDFEGSLREAILDADESNDPGIVEIDFAHLTNPTIMLQAILPTITRSVYIDGGVGSNCVMLVLDGSDILAGPTNQDEIGNIINVRANDSTVRDIDFVNFITNPLAIEGSNDTVADCYVDVDASGEVAEGNLGVGIGVYGSNNTIGSILPGNGNVVSNSGLTGILVGGGTNNVIEGNIVGLDLAGTIAMGNGNSVPSGQDGSGIAVDSASNTIGGVIPAVRNVISANGQHGIFGGGSESLDGMNFGGNAFANNNLIEGNFIGTDITGTIALGNKSDGILLTNVTNNTIGGTSGTSPTTGLSGAANLISANGASGVEFQGSASTGNQVLGNFIGVDSSGANALGNADDGVEIDSSATGNTIGGGIANAMNLISGNLANGIGIVDGAGSILVQGNFIGTDLTGTVSGKGASGANLKNGSVGIQIVGSSNNTIGGADVANPAGALVGDGNLISGNGGGITITQLAGETVSSGNLILGNFIGTDVTGEQPLPNTVLGIEINSDSNTIGGATPATRNIISGNLGDGITVVQTLIGAPPGIPPHAPVMNLIQNNYIGTDVSGKNRLGNLGNGVNITGGSSNTVGGTTRAAANVISNNGARGVQIIGSASAPAANNVVDGNVIGTDVTLTQLEGNGTDGIGIINSSGNVIGSAASGGSTGNPPGDTIAANTGNAVFIQGSLATGNTVADNHIGLGAPSRMASLICFPTAAAAFRSTVPLATWSAARSPGLPT